MEEKLEYQGKVVVNKLSIWGFIENWQKRRRLGMHKKPITKDMLEESAKVKALIRSRDAIEAVNEKLYQQVIDLTEMVGSKSSSMEEKLIDGVIKMFASKPKDVSNVTAGASPHVEKQETLGTVIEKTDQELTEMISNSSVAEKEHLKNLSVSEISQHLNSSGANISDKSIIRAKEILAQNGTG